MQRDDDNKISSDTCYNAIAAIHKKTHTVSMSNIISFLKTVFSTHILFQYYLFKFCITCIYIKIMLYNGGRDRHTYALTIV